MSVDELASEVKRLSSNDLAVFAEWFENFAADSWDKQIGTDVASGKLDHLGKPADAQLDAGRCTSL